MTGLQLVYEYAAIGVGAHFQNVATFDKSNATYFYLR
jgi:hypothetical protein